MSNKSITFLVDEKLEHQINVVAATDGLNRSELMRKLVLQYVSDHPVIAMFEQNAPENIKFKNNVEQT